MELQAKRALARLVEASTDYKTARLIARTVQSRSLFHAQQCIEKSLKACLSKVLIGEIKVHEVVKLLKQKILPLVSQKLQQQFLEIEKEAFWIEKRWIDSRKEEVGENGEILLPTLRFQKLDAKECLFAAQKTFRWSHSAVTELFGVRLPKSHSQLLQLAEKELGPVSP